ncbi:MAG: hypothetical protein QNM02_16225 [Acidimicrobiia bacterium]|nr:hypothetical protein [Acidimicrobiia bacterium]
MTLLDGDAIKALIVEVAAELDDQAQRRIIVVGGSLLAWHGLRDATEDVDSIRLLDDALREAVKTVAARHGLAANWLNDHAAPWAPATLDVGACDVLFEQGKLCVLGLPLRDVFLMKLNRGDPPDLVDMRSIWPLVRGEFASAVEVMAAYYAAFPNEDPQDDPHLGDFVVAELAKGGFDLAVK